MISFAFNDRIVARASATLDQWKAVEYGPLPIDRGDRTNVWVRDGDDLIRVGQIRGRGGAAQLGTVTVYDHTDGRLTGVLTAPRGARDGDGRSEEHTSELQSLMRISYAVFCLKKKKQKNKH